MEVRVVLDRFVNASLCREIEERLRSEGAELASCSGRELVIRWPGFTVQFIPVLIGLLAALGIGVVSVIFMNRAVSIGRSLGEALIQGAPLIAAMILAIGVLTVLLKR